MIEEEKKTRPKNEPKNNKTLIHNGFSAPGPIRISQQNNFHFPIKRPRERLPSAHRQTLLQHLASMCFSFAESSFSRSVENIRTSDTIPAPVRLCDPKINKVQCSVRNKSLIGFVAAGGAYVWKMSFFLCSFTQH